MQVNIFTVISKVFYIICILIINIEHNYVYGHGYSDHGQYFTVHTDYCTYYVGPKARNTVTSIGFNLGRHSYYVKKAGLIGIDGAYDFPAISSEWLFGQYKVEFKYVLIPSFGDSHWQAVGNTDSRMAKKKISCTSGKDSADSLFYGLFSLYNEKRKTVCRTMHFKDRSLYSDGRVMNLAPLTIGEPGQGGGLRSGGDGYMHGGTECRIPGLRVYTGITISGKFNDSINLPPKNDEQFVQFQRELRGGASTNIFFPNRDDQRTSEKTDWYPCNAEYIGGSFKAYAGLLFYHRVRSHIDNFGTIQGYYGIAAACPIPYRGDIDNVKNGTGFYGSILNERTGIIQGEKASIDINGGDTTYNSIGDVDIYNYNFIKGSIIIPKIQSGKIVNNGSIVPYLSWPMHLYLGKTKLYNQEDSIIRTLSLNILNDVHNSGSIFTETLSCTNFKNNHTGIISIKKCKKAIFNNFGDIILTDDSSVTNDVCINNRVNAIITADKNLSVDNRDEECFINNGQTTVKNTLYSFNFKNTGFLSVKRIAGSDLVNNREIVGDLLTIDANVTNNATVTADDLQVNNNFLNTGNVIVKKFTINTISFDNEGVVELEDSLDTINNGKLLNKVNATFKFVGDNFDFHPDRTKVINSGNFIVDNNLKLHANLTTAATYDINTFFSDRQIKLIKTAESYCRIKNFADGAVQNLEGIIIENVVGNAYIDSYIPPIVTEVSNTGRFNIDYLSPGSLNKAINNHGTVTINNKLDVYDNTFFNFGDVISSGHTHFSGKYTFLNQGNFTFGNTVTTDYSSFIFMHSKVNKKVIFSESVDSNMNLQNSAILQLNKPISLASYQGGLQDDIIINTSVNISASTTYLYANNKIELFNQGSDPKSRLIINTDVVDLTKKRTMTLFQAKKITNIYNIFGQFKDLLYGDINYLSKLDNYAKYNEANPKKLLFLLENPRVIENVDATESLLVDCYWGYTPRDFYKPDENGIYSMDYINRLIYGYINVGINFDIFCDGSKQWYIDKNKLYIGRANKTLPITPIELVTSNIPDAFSITSLMKLVSAGYIEVLSNIYANNSTLQANALAIRSKVPIPSSYSSTKLPEYLIYILDKIKINKSCRLEGGEIDKSGLEVDCPMAGEIENHGFITGYNGINIIGPLNYVDGSITNYGDIVANRVINTNMSIFYDSDKYKKCIIANYKKMQGSFVLGGYNCDFINEGTVISNDEGIIGHFSTNNNIYNKGDMDLSYIKIEESSSTLNLINNGNISIKNSSVFSKLTNNDYIYVKGNLTLAKLLNNTGTLITEQLNTSKKIQLKYDSITPSTHINNSGTIIIGKSFSTASALTNQRGGVITVTKDLHLLSNNFTNYGKISTNENIYIETPYIRNYGLLSANTFFIKQSIELSSSGEIHTTEIKPADDSVSIKGAGKLFINNKLVQFNKNWNISADKLIINTNKMEIFSTVNINTNNLIINDNSNTCNLTIHPGKQLTLKSSNPISQNINLINNGSLELKCSLHDNSTPLTKIDDYTANRGSSLILTLPDFLSANKEVTDLTVPIMQINNIAKIDARSSKIIIKPTGSILRDTISEIIIMQAARLEDENHKPLKSAEYIVNKTFKTHDIELTLDHIRVKNNSIVARANMIDQRALGPNMRRANQLLSSDKIGKDYQNTNETIVGVAYTYNHKVDNLAKPINSASLTSAYTDNIILSPKSVITYGLNFNAQNLIISPDRLKEINSALNIPALIIGTTVVQDEFFKDHLNNYIEFDSINLSNIIINGKKNYRAEEAKADGLVISGNNSLRLKDGISFATNTQILAGDNKHAVNFANYYVGDVINNGVIGDGVNYSGVHLNQPIEGSLVNNNSIIAKFNAIDIKSTKSWNQGKGFNIINNGNITGNIEVNCDSGIYVDSVQIINNATITAHAINSYNDNIDIYIKNNGLIKIAGVIKAFQKNFINNGTLDANNLILESDILSKGDFTANYLQGKGYKLTANHIKVHNIENVHLDSKLLEVYSSIAKKVTVDNSLVISGNVENHGELKTKSLQFANNSNITNNSSITITDKTVKLDNSIFDNRGNLTISNTLQLTGNFSISKGKLFADTLDTSGNSMVASENAIICCNNLMNTNDNSNIVMQQGSVFELGDDITANGYISGDISFSKVGLSEYSQNKYEAPIKIKKNLVCNNGILQAGNIITDSKKPINLQIKNKAQVLFSLPLQEEKLYIDNKGMILLVEDSYICNYEGEDATILISLNGDNKINNSLVVNNNVKFNNNSVIKLKPSIDANPTSYSHINLITTPLNKITYKDSSGTSNVITKENAWSIIVREENNKRIIRLKDIKVTNDANHSMISAMIGIRNITNFPSYMVYLDQKLHKQLFSSNCCRTSEAIEGIVFGVNYQNKIIQSNNLIISPYTLVDTYRIASFNIDSKDLSLSSANKKNSTINATAKIPALIIGTEITSTDATQKIVPNNNAILAINSIIIDNLVIDGSKQADGTIVRQDGLLITGSNALHLANILEIGTNCSLQAQESNHPLHIAAEFKGDIANFGNIGTDIMKSKNAIFISQPYSGVITNYNKIIAQNSALLVYSESNWTSDKQLTLVNKGDIIGSIIVNKNVSAKQDINVNLVNHGTINGYDNDDNHIQTIKQNNGAFLNIHNKNHGEINITELDVDTIINDGIMIADRVFFNQIKNFGIFVFSGNKKLTINDKNLINFGLITLHADVELSGTFTNNGTIETSKNINSGLHKLSNKKAIVSTATASVNSCYLINYNKAIIDVSTLTIAPSNNISENDGIIITNAFIQQGTLINNSVLRITQPFKLTPKLVNNGTLDIISTMELADNYYNNGYIKTDILDGKNLTINNNSTAMVESSKFNNITIKGKAVVRTELTGTVNITNLYSDTDVYQYGKLTAEKWVSDNSKIINYGSMDVNKLAIYHLINYGSLKTAILRNEPTSKGKIIIDNYNDLYADKIQKYTLNNYAGARAVFKTIDNINIVNRGILKVTESLNNDITIAGILDIVNNVEQYGTCNIEFIKGDNLTVYGLINSSIVNVNNLYNEATLNVSDKLIVNGGNLLDNYGYIATSFIEIRGKLVNNKLSVLNVLKQGDFYLSDKNCKNQGSINTQNNIFVDDIFKIEPSSSITAKTINIDPNTKIINQGNIYLSHIKNKLLSSKIFKNIGKLTVSNDIILQENFHNDGIIYTNNICSFNQSAKLVNKSNGLVRCNNVKDIIVVNKGIFRVDNNILGDVRITGSLSLGNNINQYGSLSIEDIQVADKITNINLNIQNNSFVSLSKPFMNNAINISNNGCLQILASSEMQSYTSNGGILKIYLPEDLSKIKQPLLTVASTISLNESSLIVLLADNYNKINNKSNNKITIVEAHKILLNKNKLQQEMLKNILAVQDSATFNDSIITNSVLLYVNSYWVETANRVSINADVQWENVKNIKGLLSRPISLSKLAEVLQQEKNISHKKQIFATINDNINKNKIPKESCHIISSLNRIMDLDKILSLTVPENSSHDQDIIIGTINESIANLDKRLMLERIPKFNNNQKTGINSGSIYNNFYIWSSVSFQKENIHKQSLYSYGNNISNLVNVGVDNRFNKQLTIGFMLANIATMGATTGKRFNAEHDVTRNYEIKGTSGSIYLSQTFDICTLNIYLNTAKYKFKQKMNELFSNTAIYDASVFGLHGEVIYPFYYGNFIFELAKLIRINSIYLSTYNFDNQFIKYGSRCNVVNIGVSGGCCYFIPISSYFKLYLGCSITYIHNFTTKQRHKISISYFNNDFKLAQQEINKHDIKLESLVDFILFDKLKLVCNVGLGFKSRSSYLNGKLKLNYNF